MEGNGRDRRGRDLPFRLGLVGRFAVGDIRLLLDHLADLVDVERLRQNVIELFASRLGAQETFGIGGDGNQPRQPVCARRRLGFERGGDLQAVHVGQMIVQQGDVVWLLAQRRERLQAVRGDIDLMAALIEQQLQEIVRDGAVLRHEHAAGGGVVRLGPGVGRGFLDCVRLHHSALLVGPVASRKGLPGIPPGKPLAVSMIGDTRYQLVFNFPGKFRFRARCCAALAL